MTSSLTERVRTAITTATGSPLGACEVRPVPGGDIHQSYVLVALTPYFVKVNTADKVTLFQAEALALQALAATHTLRVPKPIVWEVWEDSSFLVLEYIPLQKGASHQFRRMGEHLAALHRATSPQGKFGWAHANYIGTTPQPNAWTDSWIDFWRDQRLGFQFRLARQKGLALPGADRLLEQLPAFFADTTVAPSLLHGDLWGGNAAFDEHGLPVIFDPASYYGDRECDLAFTELFGGFTPSFYEGYDATWPRQPGWERRRDLYNLYHILNHFNLFGRTYAPQAESLLDRINRSIQG
ncbi:fructosamine kinase family protein [Verrucomicrobium spinosum]|uniref:fructosamine kinase family protein n=1 Tax=Verrucomicrobium spinosum TaxID=2736 RepID=UPI0001744981|nr:fructosamine kinase family protein [Verrucomicrobium spinosum]